MIILKHALLGSFRIALLGMLKFALFTYTFFLPNTGFAANGPESDGQASKIAAYGADHNGNISVGKKANLPG
ncbi:MAG TPA: hypothetical protein VIE66_13840 [Methylocella sp.]